MRILLTGTSGQLGWELRRSLALLGELITPGRGQFDLADVGSIRSHLDQIRPDLIVNPGAYTAVDKAETEQAGAFAVNAEAPGEMARWCAAHGRRLVHYSTDYVFNGGGTTAFVEGDPTGPVNVYGQSKLAGEQAIQASGCEHLILRTSWVYAARGSNFLNTMLRVAASRPELRVVDDQIGAPTPARMLADATTIALTRIGAMRPMDSHLAGVFHVAPAGFTSWHGFAMAIMALRTELEGSEAPRVLAIPTTEYPTPASRPLNSRLDCTRFAQAFGVTFPHWQDLLRHVMNDRLGG